MTFNILILLAILFLAVVLALLIASARFRNYLFRPKVAGPLVGLLFLLAVLHLTYSVKQWHEPAIDVAMAIALWVETARRLRVARGAR